MKLPWDRKILVLLNEQTAIAVKHQDRKQGVGSMILGAFDHKQHCSVLLCEPCTKRIFVYSIQYYSRIPHPNHLT